MDTYHWVIVALNIVTILISTLVNKDSVGERIFFLVITSLAMLVIFAGGIVQGHKFGQVDALKGKFDYKMEIKYESRDSTYIPIDTLFVEIKK